MRKILLISMLFLCNSIALADINIVNVPFNVLSDPEYMPNWSPACNIEGVINCNFGLQGNNTYTVYCSPGSGVNYTLVTRIYNPQNPSPSVPNACPLTLTLGGQTYTYNKLGLTTNQSCTQTIDYKNLGNIDGNPPSCQ